MQSERRDCKQAYKTFGSRCGDSEPFKMRFNNMRCVQTDLDDNQDSDKTKTSKCPIKSKQIITTSELENGMVLVPKHWSRV